MTIVTNNVDIHGLNCPNCALQLERAISGRRGVHHAQIALVTETATFEYDSDIVSSTQIESTIQNMACESTCFDMRVSDGASESDDSEAELDWEPAEDVRGCCRVRVDDRW
jgi:cation transport ATPase